MEEILTQNDQGSVTDPNEPAPMDGYVSPDVLAAQAGETVDFSKHVLNDEEPDTDA